MRVARRCIQAMAAAAALSSFSIAAQAQDRTNEYRLANELHITFFSVDFGCLTPAAARALAITNEEIDKVNQARHELTYSNGLVRFPRTLNAEQQAEGSALDAIQARLAQIAAALRNLPPCNIQGYPVFTYNGVWLGIVIIKSWGGQVVTERFIRSNEINNQFKDNHDPLGVGLQVGYGFTPWSNGVVVAPFLSAAYPNQSVLHNFIGGSFIGTTSNFAGTLGVKIGPTVASSVWLYGLAGASVLNETLKLNFIPLYNSTTTTVPGATIGAGVAWQPAAFQIANHPLSVFLEYQHTWWQDAHFNAPAASPFFNYTFARQDDSLKFGVNISLGDFSAPPVPPPAPAFPVKARPH